jgi:hypothetical protein
MFGGNSSQSFCSGSAEFPAHADLIRGLLTKLLTDGKWEWVHFEAANRDHCLEIADDVNAILINLPFPFAQSLEEKFQRAGVTLPADWKLTTFRRRGWWRAGHADFTAPRDSLEDAVAFSVDVFQRLFGVDGREPIKGWLER